MPSCITFKSVIDLTAKELKWILILRIRCLGSSTDILRDSSTLISVPNCFILFISVALSVAVSELVS